MSISEFQCRSLVRANTMEKDPSTFIRAVKIPVFESADLVNSGQTKVILCKVMDFGHNFLRVCFVVVLSHDSREKFEIYILSFFFHIFKIHGPT